MMTTRHFKGFLLLTLTLSCASSAFGLYQFYPRRFGGYGWSQWGADPGAGYMAGLGSYAKGQGVYNLETAKAQSIQRDSIVKWNKAMMAQNKVLAAQKAVTDAAAQQQRNEAQVKARLASGATLNDQLDQVLASDPAGNRAAAASAPVPAAAVLDIPFYSETEGISLCLDQMTGEDGWPASLSREPLVAAKRKVVEAVDKALAEDKKGTVDPATVKQLQAAVLDLQKSFESEVPAISPDYGDSQVFLKTLAGLSGLLQDPDIKPILNELKSLQGAVKLGDLVRFMHTFNLRFAPAESDRQRDIYTRLTEELDALIKNLATAPPEPTASGASALPAAAGDVFGTMDWESLKAHAGTP